MLIPGAVTVVSLINSVLSSAKTANDLAKDTSNLELKEQISGIYDAVLDIKERALALDEENRLLKAELDKKASLKGPIPPFGYYYKSEHPEHPLCPICIQSAPPREAFLSDIKRYQDSTYRTCRLCNKKYSEKPLTLPQNFF